MQPLQQKVACQTAQRRHRPGQGHLEQRHVAVGTAVQQHHQVAHVVRHLVRQHRHGSDQPQAHVGDKSRGDQHTVAKAVHAVAGEHRPAAHADASRRVVMVGVVMPLRVSVVVGSLRIAMLVAVVPQLGLFQNEEKHHAHQQGGKQVLRAGLAFKRLGQQVHKGRRQQGARRQAQKMLWPDAARPAPQAAAQQPRRQPHTADAGRQSGQNDCY